MLAVLVPPISSKRFYNFMPISSTSPKQFLRWAGSKQKLTPKLSLYWSNNYCRYVEPFMGSACLFYAIQPTNALLTDINMELVETFTAVRDYPSDVFNAYIQIPQGKENYYKVRSSDTSTMNPIDRAARFIFLNRFCFNGLYRTNLNGEFNVPFSSSKTGNLPKYDELLLASQALKCAEIYSSDFEEVLAKTTEGDFVYLDPPYAVANRRVFRQYAASCFGIEDLSRLEAALRTLHKRGVRFVVSYAYCSEALSTFRHWKMRKVLIQRNIAGFAKHRRRAAELIISNCPE
ncbi:MAG TPA: Dam family site-specific DNA-(adenine-N6)-methyltransferase [Blastocatellia bacterium]|nr:Dam family site-specific DNA-(adenine-N6)-methyltransferase [Blastocatellia bacterium]